MPYALHWPGYNYLGPGTHDFSARPINALDAAARQHDLDYGKIGAKAYYTWNWADDRFLRRISRIRGPAADATRAIFIAKRGHLKAFSMFGDYDAIAAPPPGHSESNGGSIDGPNYEPAKIGPVDSTDIWDDLSEQNQFAVDPGRFLKEGTWEWFKWGSLRALKLGASGYYGSMDPDVVTGAQNIWGGPLISGLRGVAAASDRYA